MGLSSDPSKRRAQLANLRRGGASNTGSFKPGQPSPTLKHGLRSRRPSGVLLGDSAREIVEALEETVPLRGADGQVLPQFALAVEAAALQLIIVKRVAGYLSTNGWEDARGRLRPEVEGLERALGRLTGMLDQLGATPKSYARLGFDVARGFDLAQHWADQDAVERTGLNRFDVLEGGDG